MKCDLPWRPEALLRLVVGVLTCVLLGAWAGLLWRAWSGEHLTWRVSLAAVVGMIALGWALRMTRQPIRWDSFRRWALHFGPGFYVGLVLLSLAHQWVPGLERRPGLPQLVLAGLSFQGATLVLVTLFLREHGTGWREAFGLRLRPGRALGLGVATACVILPVAWALQLLTMAVLHRFHYPAEVQVAVQVLQTTPDWRQQLAMAVVAIGLAPPAEEALFRGLLFHTLQQVGYPRLAWWGTALLFALVHANAASFVALVGLALALAWLYERTGNLLAPIVAHAVFNALNFAALQVYQRWWAGG
ncbi:lysostaphin resistance A-like protein [Limisphaera sp. VF-2]|uniref:CPBP family intramembrane glutamic endopeptidase n=1 Tax=Limisphaera sp. VF-2 TaxID=3400418 RepID=UPI003C28B0D3